jgi:hypothetical protein
MESVFCDVLTACAQGVVPDNSRAPFGSNVSVRSGPATRTELENRVMSGESAAEASTGLLTALFLRLPRAWPTPGSSPDQRRSTLKVNFRRSGVFRQMLEHPIETAGGGVYLRLTPEQYAMMLWRSAG